MSSKKLKLADNLSLPIEAVTETFCVLGMRGKGKTHAGSVMAEEVLKHDVPAVIYDPTGAWYGLKSSIDGKHEGFPVVVFGGEHADVPLEHTAGETVARAIVANRYAAILDVSLMRKGNRVTFMADFLEALYHDNREALHFFADEVQTIAPQTMRDKGGDYARCLGAMEDLILQGRIRGIGSTVMSQRPAMVNTTVRTQCSTLIALGMSGPHDIQAIMEWVRVQATEEQAEEMVKSLPSLPRGDAWFWSPAAFEVFKRIHFRQRETYDSSQTPKVGESRRAPKVLAVPDLAKLGDAIRATVEKARANDPKNLKAEVARLKAELLKAQSAKPAESKETIKRVEVSVLKDGQLKRTEQLAGRAEKLVEAMAAATRGFAEPMAEILTAVRKVNQPATSPSPTVAAIRRVLTPSTPSPATARPSNGEAGLAGGERKILTVAAQYPEGVERDQISVLVGYKRSSRDTYLQRLRTKGLIDVSGDRIVATGDGVAALGDGFEPLPVGEALRAHWMNRLPEGERKILEVLVAQYPNVVDRDALDEPTGYKRSSRDTYLQRLTSRRLVKTAGRGGVVATDDLFDAGER